MRAVRTGLGIAAMAMLAGGALLAGFVIVLLTAVPVPSGPSAGQAVGSAALAARDGYRGGAGGGAVDWSNPSDYVQPADRVIEVRSTTWKPGTAVKWLDRYTASRMKIVTRCSAKAYRCITIRSGKVAGGNVGWSQGATITIDTAKAKRRNYSAADRRLLLVHELGHQFGLEHTTARNIMNPTQGRWKLAVTTGQKRILGKR